MIGVLMMIQKGEEKVDYSLTKIVIGDDIVHIAILIALIADIIIKINGDLLLYILFC